MVVLYPNFCSVEVGIGVSTNLVYDSAVNPAQSALTREGDGYDEVISPKGGKGGPRHIGKERDPKIPPTKIPPTKIPPTKIPPSENSTQRKLG